MNHIIISIILTTNIFAFSKNTQQPQINTVNIIKNLKSYELFYNSIEANERIALNSATKNVDLYRNMLLGMVIKRKKALEQLQIISFIKWYAAENANKIDDESKNSFLMSAKYLDYMNFIESQLSKNLQDIVKYDKTWSKMFNNENYLEYRNNNSKNLQNKSTDYDNATRIITRYIIKKDE